MGCLLDHPTPPHPTPPHPTPPHPTLPPLLHSPDLLCSTYVPDTGARFVLYRNAGAAAPAWAFDPPEEVAAEVCFGGYVTALLALSSDEAVFGCQFPWGPHGLYVLDGGSEVPTEVAVNVAHVYALATGDPSRCEAGCWCHWATDMRLICRACVLCFRACMRVV
jgi:hypothetical protein